MTLETGQSLRDAYQSLLGDVGAFLPNRTPADRLFVPLQGYLDACAELPDRYPARRGGVRRWLDALLNTIPRETENAILALDPTESWTLLTALVILGHTYRWDTAPPASERFSDATILLPEGLSAPWTNLARRLGQPRVGTMWSFHLCNWRVDGKPGASEYLPSDLTIDKLHMQRQWLDAPTNADLERFSLSFVLSEARGASVIRAIVEAIEAAAREDIQETSFRLDSLQDSIHVMSKAFIQAIKDACVDPQKWLELIQPTTTWATEDEPPELSAMQLPTLYCVDAALDIPPAGAATERRPMAALYVPDEHRRFIGLVERSRGVIREFIQKAGSLTLQRRYNDCIRAVRKFRIAHRVRGARYLNAGKYAVSRRSTTEALHPAINEAVADLRNNEVVENLANPVRELEHRMNDRIADTESALLISSEGDEDPTVESTFRFLTAADRAALIDSAPCRSFTDGELIIRQGDRRQALYVIKEGFVRIEVAGSGGRNVLARLWPGEVFGEASFLTNAEATASVIADGPVEAYVLDRAHIYSVIGQSPAMAMRFYQSLAVQLACRLRDTDAMIAALAHSEMQPKSPRNPNVKPCC